MFIYKTNAVEKLIAVTAPGRDYIKANDELCSLLENPFIADDTELAIQYNEYQHGKPGAAESFVNYYYVHAPELDVSTLNDWRNIIINDNELYQIAANINMDNIIDQKQKIIDETSFPWFATVFDCLSNPCQYANPISSSIGTLADTQRAYNQQTEGNDEESLKLYTTTLPSEMWTKIPEEFSDMWASLTTGISNMWSQLLDCGNDEWKGIRPDPYRIPHSELFCGDLFATIGSQLGDCFRLFEYNKRYNPYDKKQNIAEADRLGIVRYDKAGNAIGCSISGQKAHPINKTAANSSPLRLEPTATLPDIIDDTLINLTEGFAKFKLTIYGPILLKSGKYYVDNGANACDKKGGLCISGEDINNSIYTIPGELSSVKFHVQNKTTPWTCAVALSQKTINSYFSSLIKEKFPDGSVQLNPNIRKLNFIKSAMRKSQFMCCIKFPNGVTDHIPIYDLCGIDDRVDLTSMYFLTRKGRTAVTPKFSNGDIIPESDGNYPSIKISPSDFKNVDIKDLGGVLANIKFTSGTADIGLNNIDAYFYFSSEFCAENGLDENIYGANAHLAKRSVTSSSENLVKRNVSRPAALTMSDPNSNIIPTESDMQNNSADSQAALGLLSGNTPDYAYGPLQSSLSERERDFINNYGNIINDLTFSSENLYDSGIDLSNYSEFLNPASNDLSTIGMSNMMFENNYGSLFDMTGNNITFDDMVGQYTLNTGYGDISSTDISNSSSFLSFDGLNADGMNFNVVKVNDTRFNDSGIMNVYDTAGEIIPVINTVNLTKDAGATSTTVPYSGTIYSIGSTDNQQGVNIIKLR